MTLERGHGGSFTASITADKCQRDTPLPDTALTSNKPALVGASARDVRGIDRLLSRSLSLSPNTEWGLRDTQRHQIKSNLFVTYTWLADVNECSKMLVLLVPTMQ